MNPRITVLVLIAGTVALASSAEASPRSREVQATPIYRRAFFSGSSGSKTFATTNLRYNTALGCGAPDTILVVTRPDGTELMNDNCSTGAKNSCVITTSGPGSWLVTVFAQKESPMQNTPGAMTASAIAIPVPLTTHCGIADVTVNGALLDRDVVFGGALVEPGLSGTMRVQTVHVPNGADDTVLLGYSASWQELGYDNDTGVGRAAAKTWRLASTTKLVVGSFSPAASGRAALVLNECTTHPDSLTGACSAFADRDGDSLSNALELEIGTNPDLHDTDRDGVFDYFEVIGRQRTPQEQELRRFGANPRRRDLFVELDREINDAGDVATLYDLATVDLRFEDPFLDLPRMPPAPDGSRLIAVHFDTGAPCPTRPTLCGDWGGSAAIAQTFDETRAAGYPQFGQVRRGLFKYGYMTTGGDGQSNGSAFRASYTGAVPHELGHELGLDHWGDPTQPRLNMKPNYPSLMSYAFTTIPVVMPTRGRFSEGILGSMDGVIDEDTYGDSSDLRYLTENKWDLAVGASIDFNRDGRVGGAVYADMAPLDRGTTGNDPWPHLADATDLIASPWTTGCDPCLPTGGAALATWTLEEDTYRTVAFVPHEHGDGRVYPDVVQSTGPHGAGQWSGFTEGPRFDGSPDGEPSAALFQDAQGELKALVLFPHSGGRMFYSVVDPDQPVNATWTAIPGQAANGWTRHSNLVRVGGELRAYWRDFALNDGAWNIYEARFTIASEAWQAPTLQEVIGLTTPGVAFGPSGLTFMTNVVGTVGNYQIQTLRHGGGVGPWAISAMPPVGWEFAQLPDPEVRPKLSLELVPLLRDRDQGLEDASGQLHMSWSVFTDDGTDRDQRYWMRAQLGGYVSATISPWTRWFVRKDKTADRPHPGHSVTLAVRGPDLVAMYSGTDWDDDGALRASRFLPYAFGISPGYRGLLDNDDAGTMNDEMCKAIWDVVDGAGAGCRCVTGRPCSTATQSMEVPRCEPE